MTDKEKKVLNSVIDDLMLQLQKADLKALQDQAKITTLEVTVNQLKIQIDKLKVGNGSDE
jgi:cell division protein FtsB